MNSTRKVKQIRQPKLNSPSK